MKVLLVDPPFQRFIGFHRFYYPLGLAYMAAGLRRDGHDVLIYDGEHAETAQSLTWIEASDRMPAYHAALGDAAHPVWAELEGVVRDFAPDLVGVSALTPKLASALAVAEIVKAWNPRCPVVMGGDHATVFPEDLLRHDCVDLVARGEGEVTIKEIAARLASGLEVSPETVAGVSARRARGFAHAAPRGAVEDLDTLPFPALEALARLGTFRPVDLGAIMASRGCPYSCTFCGVKTVWGRQTRYRSPGNVVAEMRSVRRRFGTTYFSFRDASFTLDRARVVSFCDALRADRLDVEWECVTRADLVDGALLGAMRECGCRMVRIGVESGDPLVLAAMNKRIDLDEIRAAAARLHALRFAWSAYFMLGTPRETHESIDRTLDFIREIDPPFVTLSRYAPIPGTEMCAELVAAGRLSPDTDWSRESNQESSGEYVLRMAPGEFEARLREVAELVAAHNRRHLAAAPIDVRLVPPAAGA